MKFSRLGEEYRTDKVGVLVVERCVCVKGMLEVKKGQLLEWFLLNCLQIKMVVVVILYVYAPQAVVSEDGKR